MELVLLALGFAGMIFWRSFKFWLCFHLVFWILLFLPNQQKIDSLLICAILLPISFMFEFVTVFGLLGGSVVGLIYRQIYWNGAEHDGSWNSPWLRSLRIWNLLWYYFGLTVEHDKNYELYLRSARDRREPILFVVVPHGLFSMTGICFALHGSMFQEDFLLAINRVALSIPFIREFLLMCGCVGVDRQTIIEVTKRIPLGMAPGGSQEIILTDHQKLDLYLGHEGFLDLCRYHNIMLVPLFARGENRTFFTFSFLSNVLHNARATIAHYLCFPFPTFFFGPVPSELKVFCGFPINPKDFQTVEEFKIEYYRRILNLIVANELPGFPVDLVTTKLIQKISDLKPPEK